MTKMSIMVIRPQKRKYIDISVNNIFSYNEKIIGMDVNIIRFKVVRESVFLAF